MKKIIIIGTSCSGKTPSGKRLSGILHHKFIDLDDLHWLLGWKEQANEGFVGVKFY